MQVVHEPSFKKQTTFYNSFKFISYDTCVSYEQCFSIVCGDNGNVWMDDILNVIAVALNLFCILPYKVDRTEESGKKVEKCLCGVNDGLRLGSNLGEVLGPIDA